MAITFDSFRALAGDVDATRFSGGKSTVHLAQGNEGGMKLETGKWVRINVRSDVVKGENQMVRQQLLDALTDRFGGLDSIPDSVKSAMKIKDFKLDANGDVQSHRPLTMRRIKAIVNAVEDVFRQEFDATAIKSNPNVIGSNSMDDCVEMYNNLSRNNFTLGNLFEMRQRPGQVRTTNEQNIRACTQDGGRHYVETATRATKAYAQVEFVAQLSRLVKHSPDQFSADIVRNNVMNAKGQLLSKDEQEATDQIARELSPTCRTFNELAPTEKARVMIVKALVQQRMAGTAFWGLTASLNAKDGPRNAYGIYVQGEGQGANIWSFSFDHDGGISVSLAGHEHATTIACNYLIRNDVEREAPEIKGSIKSLMRLDIHIPPQEVDRIVTLLGQGEFAGVNDRQLDTGSSNLLAEQQDVIQGNERLLQDNLKIQMDVRVGAKIIVDD